MVEGVGVHPEAAIFSSAAARAMFPCRTAVAKYSIALSVTLNDGLAIYTHKRSEERPAIKALLAWLKAELA